MTYRTIGVALDANATTSEIDIPMSNFGLERTESEMEISGGFGRANQDKRGLGYGVSYNYDIALDHNTATYIFYNLLGADGYTYADGTHKYKGTGSYNPTLAAYFATLDHTTLKLHNAAITEFSLSAESEFVSCSVNGMASYDSIVTTKSQSALNNVRAKAMTYHEVDVQINGVSVGKVRSIDLSINQNGEHQFYIGSRYPDVIFTGARTVEGSFSRDFMDMDFVKKLWGDVQKGGAGESETFALSFVFARNDDSGSITITLPKAYLKNVTPNVGDRERATEDISFAALEDTVSGTDIIVEITNDLPQI